MGKFNTGKGEKQVMLPKFNEKDTMEGFEDITQETMAIPFIRILQRLSPQLDKQKPEYIEDAEEGYFFNTVTKHIYGTSLSCIVLKFEHIYIEWRPDRGGFVGWHTPENAERLSVDMTFGKWKTKEGNLLQESYVYMLLIEGHEEESIVVLPLASSMIKTAREWNRLMATHIMSNGKKAMPYYLTWNLQTEYRSNEKGNWYVPRVSFVHYINDKQYTILGVERKMLPTRRIDYRQLEASNEDKIDEGVDY